ncbi:MAG TPA: response regulator [Symbiobacteriaceae bacterium]|nr:response regulator [Symbiobacteriaceae bacterium]
MPRVLLIEDEPVIGMVLQETLGDAGYAVELMTNGRAALARIDRPPVPGLVLLDLFLPEVKGRDLLVELRSRPAWREVPVLLVTGAVPFPDDFPPEGLYQGIIRKPFDLDDLLSRVHQFFARGMENG